MSSTPASTIGWLAITLISSAASMRLKPVMMLVGAAIFQKVSVINDLAWDKNNYVT